MSEILENIDKMHTTELGVQRIKRNICRPDEETDVELISFCKSLVSAPDCNIEKRGKNWYCSKDNVELTVNSYNFCIITAKIKK